MVTKAKGKAAPAPAAEVVEGFEVGQSVKFLGYGADVPTEEQMLEADAVYEVVDVTEDGNPVVRIENPDFNAKKKEDADKNPRFLEAEVLPDEVELVEAEAEAEAAAEVAAEPAPVAAKATKGKAAVAEKAAPAAKTAAKGKAAPAAKKAAAPKAKEVVEVKDEDDLPELEGEDEAVLALVNESEDLVATAQELEASVASTEWQLGGILFHIRKDKLHREMLDGKGKKVKAYSENGGFAAFLLDFFNIDYRKAMHLIKIYVSFTQAQIENPSEVVAQIGWTKASKIAPVMAEEGADAAELVELATNNTVADLSEAIKEQVTVGGTKGEKGEKKTRITMKFRYFEEEASSVNAILESAVEQLGLKDIGEALAHIVQEWATTNGGEAAQVEDAPAQTKAVGRAAPKGTSRAAKQAA